MATSASLATPSRLISAPINIAALREDARTDLKGILNGLSGKICLVVDPTLIAPLKLIVTEGSKWMREHNVENIVELSTPTLSTECDTVLYMTRSTFELVHLIALQTKTFAARNVRKNLHIAFVPRRTFICEQLLKEEGVSADLQTCEYCLDIIPLDDDVLTMNMHSCYRECTVGGDYSSLFHVTRALLKLQAVYGPIPQVKAKGALAKRVLDMMVRLRREEEGVVDRRAGAGSSSSSSSSGSGDGGMEATTVMVGGGGGGGKGGGAGGAGGAAAAAAAAAATAVRSEIDMAVILDRGVDLVTPLVSPLTFEALLHEMLGIDNSMTQVAASLLQSTGAEGDGDAESRKAAAGNPNAKVTLHLNSNDKLYAEIRDVNQAVAASHLSTRAKEIRAMQDSIKTKDRSALQVSDIHKFVKAIPTMQNDSKSLKTLIALAELVSNEVNEAQFMERWQLERGLLDEENLKEIYDQVTALVAKRQPLMRTLRLLCLDSVIEGGLKAKWIEHFRRELVAAYGFETLFLLSNLEKAGLLTPREGSTMGTLAPFSVGSMSSWSSLRKSLNLTVDAADVESPTDIHYVTSGYAPLSVRLIQTAATQGWESMTDALRLLPGPAAQLTQVSRGHAAAARAEAEGPDGETSLGASRKVVLVVFVGGITYIEISAIRFLAEKYPVDFVILTTSIISGTSLLESMVDSMGEREEAGGGSSSKRADAAAEAGGAGAAATAAGPAATSKAAAAAPAATGGGKGGKGESSGGAGLGSLFGRKG